MKVNPLGELLAMPLQAAVRAQTLALGEALATIEAVGIEDGRIRMFRVKAERIVEERSMNSDTGSPEIRQVVQPFEIGIPLLSLLPIAPVQLQQMDVDLGVDVVDTRTIPLTSATIPSTLRAVSLSGSLARLTALGGAAPTTLKVHMRITKETPEGMARLGDLLVDLLSGKPNKGT